MLTAAAARVALAILAAGLLAGCADKNSATGAESKPLAPPTYKEPVAPTIPQPNTNPSMNHQPPPPLPFSQGGYT